MRILVTGASGFIGSRLVAKLRASGMQVLPLSHKLTLLEMTQKIRDFKPTTLVHLASVFVADHRPEDIDTLVDANVTFGVRVLESCRLAEVRRIVITGSSWQHLPHDTSTAVNLYGALKSSLETISRYYADSCKMSVAFLKLYDSYGKGDPRPKLLAHLSKIAGTGESIDMSPGDQVVDFTHVENTIDAILAACEWTQSHPEQFQTFRVSGGEPMALRQLIDLIERITGRKINIRWGSRPYRSREVMKPWTDAPELPGYKPRVSLATGLKELFETS